MKVSCNHCKEEFEVENNLVVEDVTENIVHHGFECEHCNHYYHAFYLSKRLAELQQNLIRNRTQPRNVYRKIENKYKKEFKKFQTFAKKKYGENRTHAKSTM